MNVKQVSQLFIKGTPYEMPVGIEYDVKHLSFSLNGCVGNVFNPYIHYKRTAKQHRFTRNIRWLKADSTEMTPQVEINKHFHWFKTKSGVIVGYDSGRISDNYQEIIFVKNSAFESGLSQCIKPISALVTKGVWKNTGAVVDETEYNIPHDTVRSWVRDDHKATMNYSLETHFLVQTWLKIGHHHSILIDTGHIKGRKPNKIDTTDVRIKSHNPFTDETHQALLRQRWELNEQIIMKAMEPKHLEALIEVYGFDAVMDDTAR